MELMAKFELIKKVDSALDEIRPHLEIDGGGVKIVDITDAMVVKIKWLGNCSTCSMSDFTLNGGIKQSVLQKVPEIKDVIEIKDL